MKAKKYLNLTRPDWDSVHVAIMRWVLKVKLKQNMDKFGELLLSTGERNIVEVSSKGDYYWGTIPLNDSVLVGANILGRLLMELREAFKKNKNDFLEVQPIDIVDFMLYNCFIKKCS